jgi:hypothetical protein
VAALIGTLLVLAALLSLACDDPSNRTLTPQTSTPETATSSPGKADDTPIAGRTDTPQPALSPFGLATPGPGIASPPPRVLTPGPATPTPTLPAGLTPARIPLPSQPVNVPVQVWVYPDGPDTAPTCLELLPVLLPVPDLGIAGAKVARCMFGLVDGTRLEFLQDGNGVLVLHRVHVLLRWSEVVMREPPGPIPCVDLVLYMLPASANPTNGAWGACPMDAVPRRQRPDAGLRVWGVVPSDTPVQTFPADVQCWELTRYLVGPRESAYRNVPCIFNGSEGSIPSTMKSPDSLDASASPCLPIQPGDIVLITVNVDVPSPRCVRVMPEQCLRVANNTPNPVRVQLGRFDITVAPGGAEVLDAPFGEYLAPGVHLMRVSIVAGGPAVWLLP